MAIESREGPHEKEVGKEARVLCMTCDRPTMHRVVRSAEYITEYAEPDFQITGWDEYQVLECLGCQTVSFRHTHRDTETLDRDPFTGEGFLEENVRLYPSRVAGRQELDKSWVLPWDIQRIYKETLAALRGELPVLAGIGIRAIVETICGDRRAAGHNLEARIDDLVLQGVLTMDGAEILHSLRIMGNQAAHEVKPHPVDALNTAFDVIEYVLTGVYILPQRSSTLPRRSEPPDM